MKKLFKKLKLKKNIPIIFGVIIFMVISSVTVYGLINSISTGFKATSTGTIIDAHGRCKNVAKTSGSDVFIPTKTSTEWNTFLTNHPANIDLSGCYTYLWETGGYGGCSVSCGGGTKTRSVWCERDDGTHVADSFCTGIKPSTTLACNTSCCTHEVCTRVGYYTTCGCGCGTGSKSVGRCSDHGYTTCSHGGTVCKDWAEDECHTECI